MIGFLISLCPFYISILTINFRVTDFQQSRWQPLWAFPQLWMMRFEPWCRPNESVSLSFSRSMSNFVLALLQVSSNIFTSLYLNFHIPDSDTLTKSDGLSDMPPTLKHTITKCHLPLQMLNKGDTVIL